MAPFPPAKIHRFVVRRVDVCCGYRVADFMLCQLVIQEGIVEAAHVLIVYHHGWFAAAWTGDFHFKAIGGESSYGFSFW
jgi:hypothetical protein